MTMESEQGKRVRAAVGAPLRWLRSLPGGLLVPTLLFAVLLLTAFVAQQRATKTLHRAFDQRSVVDRQQALADEAQKLLLDLETGVRGFVITRDARLLEPWQRARVAFPVKAAALVRGAEQSRNSVLLAREIQRDGSAYIQGYATPLVRAVRRSRGHPASVRDTLEGKRRVDALRAKFTRLGREQLARSRGPERQATSAEARAEALGLASVLGTLGLLIVLGLYLARAVVKPLGRVTRAADRVAEGDLSARVKPTGTTELLRLTESFNAMAGALQHGRDQLESQAEQLRESRSFLDSVLENIPAMIFVKDAEELRFVRFNQAGEELLGRSKDELMGKNDYDLFSRREADFFTSKDRDVLAVRELADIPEEPIETNGNGVRYLHTRKIPILDERGEPRYLVGISEDITDRKRAEQAVRDAKEEAERANTAKSEFLSRMSHELRTPLNAILGFGQLLESDDISDKQRERVHYIVKGGRHLLELINEVLDISRIEAGNLAFSTEPVAVDAVVGDAIALVGPLASERDIEIETSLVGCRTHVLADQQRFKQVLLNLLSNAIKYNRDGGDVRVSCQPVDHRRLRIDVSDTGFGIPKERLADVFVPFDRLGAEQGEVEGSGLGLALSRRLVEAMDGTMTVESNPGAGSVFSIELPLADAPGEGDGPPESPKQSGEDELSGAPAQLLYIEDNLSNVRLIEDVLDRRPHLTLETAMQGGLGIDLARQHQPDVILLDLHLPDLDGEVVLRRLRSDPRTTEIPVLVLTADATPGQAKRLRSAGASAYLTKPLDVEDLLAALDGALDRKAVAIP